MRAKSSCRFDLVGHSKDGVRSVHEVTGRNVSEGIQRRAKPLEPQAKMLNASDSGVDFGARYAKRIGASLNEKFFDIVVFAGGFDAEKGDILRQ